jgi:RND family efflux transporter MFP subunit
VLAPRDGVVVSKNILPSQEVNTEGSLIEIADISTVWVMADVFESDATGLIAGTDAKISLPSVPGFSIEAPVEMVSSVVDPERHSVPVRVLLDNADGKLKPNVYAELRFKTTLPEGASEVASSALVSDGANQFVYVQEGEGRFVRRKVVAGPVRDGMVAILEGLKPGETIVEQGSILLENQIALTH